MGEYGRLDNYRRATKQAAGVDADSLLACFGETEQLFA